MKFLKCLAILSLIFSETYAQQDTLQFINDRIFRYIEDASEDIEDAEFQSNIEELMLRPIDLNSALRRDLLRIPFLTIKSANVIIQERERRNGFKSFSELFSIKSIHHDLFLLIKPFVTIKNNKRFIKDDDTDKFIFEFRTRSITDLQNREGFSNKKFRGNKLKYYNRLKVRYANFVFGILTEKDPGEVSLTDHYAGYIEYKSDGFLNDVLLGDFNLEFGQGLLLWRPYAFSKGSEAVISPIKHGRNYYPFLSAEENLFFRGVMASMNFWRIDLTLFYSAKSMDATLAGNYINSIYLSGYHRTKSEMIKSDNVDRKSYGLIFNFKPNEDIRFGMAHYNDGFDKNFVHKNKFELKGKDFSYTSLDYNILHKNINFAGELGFNGRSYAFINNIFFPVSNNVDALVSYRNYSPAFSNMNSNGFGEFGNTKNEIGFYFGIKILTKLGKFNFYQDYFKNPEPSFASEFPASGSDFLINYDIALSSETHLLIKYKREKKESTINDLFKSKIISTVKSNYKIDLNYELSGSIYGRTRIEYVTVDRSKNSETGFLTYQQIKVKLKDRISFIGRVIFFDTESYNSRIYEFENDVLGVMSNIPLFGEGLRWYLLFNFKLAKNIKFYFKYSETYKPYLTEISSGNSKIIGNLDNRISLQFDISF